MLIICRKSDFNSLSFCCLFRSSLFIAAKDFCLFRHKNPLSAKNENLSKQIYQVDIQQKSPLCLLLQNFRTIKYFAYHNAIKILSKRERKAGTKMLMRIKVKGSEHKEQILLHKNDGGHFDCRAKERLGCNGSSVIHDLYVMLNSKEWHNAWINANIQPDQEIMIINHMIGIAIPIKPRYKDVTIFTVKTVADISASAFSIHDRSFVFEWDEAGTIKTYTYNKPVRHRKTAQKKQNHVPVRAYA